MKTLDVLLEELQKAKIKMEKPEGISDRGIEARRADPKVSGVVSHGYARVMSPEKHGERAKTWAKQDLASLKAQPKPNLTKDEEEMMMAEKNVNVKDPVLNYDKVGPKAMSDDKQKALNAKIMSTVKKDEDMEKDSANPALAPKERKIKDLQSQIDAGTYKPDSKKIAGAMLKFDEEAVDKPPMPSTTHKEIPIKDKEKKQLVDAEGNTIERLEFTKDGQWVLVKSSDNSNSNSMGHSATPATATHFYQSGPVKYTPIDRSNEHHVKLMHAIHDSKPTEEKRAHARKAGLEKPAGGDVFLYAQHPKGSKHHRDLP